MNLELAAAKGNLADLKLRIEQAVMAVDEERRNLREATGIMFAARGLDAVRITFLTARLVRAIEELKTFEAEAARIREEYNL